MLAARGRRRMVIEPRLDVEPAELVERDSLFVPAGEPLEERAVRARDVGGRLAVALRMTEEPGRPACEREHDPGVALLGDREPASALRGEDLIGRPAADLAERLGHALPRRRETEASLGGDRRGLRERLVGILPEVAEMETPLLGMRRALIDAVDERIPGRPFAGNMDPMEVRLAEREHRARCADVDEKMRN